MVTPVRLMYAAAGVRVAVIGQMIKGLVTWTSVRMVNDCVVVAILGKLTLMSDKGEGIVSNVAVEHGSFIITLKFACYVCKSTVAVRI